ncbi:hypothetical protein QJS66_21640 [Kocuria rhizophila]|nr:hypothetical protein QJS66_21640 [Kocuria rhizophila]
MDRAAERSAAAGDGSREMPMVPDTEFTSYGRPIVKAPPWDSKIASLCSSAGCPGARRSSPRRVPDREARARDARLSALTAAGLGGVLLVAVFGRPTLLHMMRAFKPTSPISISSWVLADVLHDAGVARGGGSGPG